MDSPKSEAGQCSYSRNSLITMGTFRNGLCVALAGVAFLVGRDMKYMDVARIRLAGHED